MPSQPTFSLFVADWLGDPALSMCSPSTRGIWFDWLLAMHAAGRTGELRLSLDHLAKAGRCSLDEALRAIEELSQTGAGEVLHVTPKSVTCNAQETEMYAICNRRMRREFLKRKSSKERVSRHRERYTKLACNANSNQNVTPLASTNSISSTEEERSSSNHTARARGNGMQPVGSSSFFSANSQEKEKKLWSHPAVQAWKDSRGEWPAQSDAKRIVSAMPTMAHYDAALWTDLLKKNPGDDPEQCLDYYAGLRAETLKGNSSNV